MNSEHPDFILECDRHPNSYVVQNYAWKDDQDHWVPMRKKTTRITMLRGDSPDGFWDSRTPTDQLGVGKGPLREHHEISCGASGCRNKVAADYDDLGEVFSILATVNRPRSAPLGEWRAAFADLAQRVDPDRSDITLTLDSLRLALRLRNMLHGHAGK